jgi:hypothetical protein
MIRSDPAPSFFLCGAYQLTGGSDLRLTFFNLLHYFVCLKAQACTVWNSLGSDSTFSYSPGWGAPRAGPKAALQCVNEHWMNVSSVDKVSFQRFCARIS